MILHRLKYKKKLAGLLVATVLSGVAFHAISNGYAAIPSGEEAPVDFAAASVEYDEANQKVTALGDVEIIQSGRIVKADRVVYDLKTEVVSAEGNVALLEKNGDVHFVDKADLAQAMKNGYIKKLRSVLADGSRFTAEEGRREDGVRTVMEDATYTPCEPCKANPEKPPSWQIRADKVIHDNDEHTITYKDATLEVAGTPIAYVPYFSHPDGTIKQKSGFLAPIFNLSSNLGFSATPQYYLAIDETQDATLGVRTFIEHMPMLLGEYRKRFNDAELEVSGGVNYSDRTDSSGGEYEYVDDEMRGHFFGKGLWDINEKWRAGFDAAVASDDQYMRQFDITSDDVLENEIYVERFDDRDYATLRAFSFQDLRISDRAADQPNVLPEALVSFLGQPGDTFGGRWSFDASTLGLMRDGSGQDVLRGSATAGWERKDIFDIGLVNVISASIRGDVYNVPKRDEDLLGSGDGDSSSSRFYPVLHNVTSYPMVNNISDEAQVVFEPIVSFTAVSDVKNNSDIPNEDSQDVQLDANNLFEPNRFPGLDRVDDSSHVTYGARVGAHGADGSMGEIFLGQSYRLDDDDNPFPAGSGLDTQTSNYVGEINAILKGDLNVNYRFELSSQDFSSERHELDASAVIDRFTLSGAYFFARSLEGTDLTTSREQIYSSIAYDFSDEWRSTLSGRYDLSEEDQGLRNAGLLVEYLGQCYTVSASAVRNFTFESTGDAGTEVMLRVGLKNLGEFGSGS